MSFQTRYAPPAPSHAIFTRPRVPTPWLIGRPSVVHIAAPVLLSFCAKMPLAALRESSQAMIVKPPPTWTMAGACCAPATSQTATPSAVHWTAPAAVTRRA